MTGYADDLDSYYSPGKEIVCFRDNKDLLDIIKYYLANEDNKGGRVPRITARTMP